MNGQTIRGRNLKSTLLNVHFIILFNYEMCEQIIKCLLILKLALTRLAAPQIFKSSIFQINRSSVGNLATLSNVENHKSLNISRINNKYQFLSNMKNIYNLIFNSRKPSYHTVYTHMLPHNLQWLTNMHPHGSYFGCNSAHTLTQYVFETTHDTSI